MLSRAALRSSRVVARRAAHTHAAPKIHVVEGKPSAEWLAKNSAVTDHAARSSIFRTRTCQADASDLAIYRYYRPLAQDQVRVLEKRVSRE
jgi:hypothetical protein